ncbi:hypothetical protein B296_00040887, partial [Ensete ventricosum]
MLLLSLLVKKMKQWWQRSETMAVEAEGEVEGSGIEATARVEEGAAIKGNTVVDEAIEMTTFKEDVVWLGSREAGTSDAAYEERGSEQDEREFGYSPRGKEAPSGAPTEKKGHRERLTLAETCLDVLEASVEELYQGHGRLFEVESSQEEAEARIEKVESLIDQLTED